MPIFQPFAFRAPAAGPSFNPPIEAGAFAFHGATYSGTGDWVDDTNGYSADLYNSPTFVSDGNSSYWELDGVNQYFQVPNTDTPAAVWNTQGVANSAEGTAEFVIYADDLDANSLLSMWAASEYNRSILIGNTTTAGVLGTLYQTTAPGRTYRSTNIGLAIGNWKHLVITWSMPNNRINFYINNSSAGSNTWADTTNTWVANDNLCLVLGCEVADCTGPKNFWDGKIASVRGYHQELTSTDVSTMYTFWSEYFTFA